MKVRMPLENWILILQVYFCLAEPSTAPHEAHRGDSGFAEANAGLQPAAVLKPDRDNDASWLWYGEYEGNAVLSNTCNRSAGTAAFLICKNERETYHYYWLQRRSRNHSFINTYDFCFLLKLTILHEYWTFWIKVRWIRNRVDKMWE